MYGAVVLGQLLKIQDLIKEAFVNPDLVYRVTLRCPDDSIWVRQEIFMGNYQEFLAKFGSRSENPLRPFIQNERTYIYYISFFKLGYWRETTDPRPRE